MHMCFEVIGRTTYTIDLTEKDMEKVKQRIKKRRIQPWESEESIILEAIEELYFQGELDIYEKNKCTESDFSTEEFNWSEFEDRSAEEILKELMNEPSES